MLAGTVLVNIDALYDCLDTMVADLSKSLNALQVSNHRKMEEQLRTIREDSVRADAINRSIQNFLMNLQQAYNQTFSAFLKN